MRDKALFKKCLQDASELLSDMNMYNNSENNTVNIATTLFHERKRILRILGKK